MAKKILVCDDDEGILEIIKIMLGESGYDVKTVNTGKGIEKKIEEYQPDLILLDLWLAGMDGREIIKVVRRNNSLKGIPVVIISALNDTEKISEEIHADGFLAKPFDMEQLLQTAKKYTAS